MKKSKRVLFLGVSLLLILSNCTKYNEEAPFFNELFLEYDVMGYATIYNVETLDDNQFKITETEKRGPLSDDIEELFVDEYGKVYKSTFKDYEGKFSPIWIPVHEMEIGDTFNNGYKVIRREQWKKWEVFVIQNPLFPEERYFDTNTGYRVGAEGKAKLGRYKAVLINTNADIPTVEE